VSTSTVERPSRTAPEPYVTTDAIADYLGKPRSWIDNYAARRNMPRHKVGNHYRYRYSEVDAWIERGCQ